MIPQYLKKAICSHKTSIGDNPCLPPDEEEVFLCKIVGEHYNDIMMGENEVDIKHLKYAIDKLNTQCQQLEEGNKEALEEMVDRCVHRVFDITEDSIDLSVKLSGNVDSTKERELPESTDDMEFDDIEDMRNLSDEVYKRRMLNCLVAGAAHHYATNFALYLEDLFNINDELPSLYKKLMLYNEVLLYNDPKLKINAQHDSGKVSVNITASRNPEMENGLVCIDAEAINAPLLLEEAIKGILELAITHGLPDDYDKAVYVMKKSDFKLAEIWDLRIGIPLWKRIEKMFGKGGSDISSVGPNFVLYTISKMEPSKFNKVLSNILKGTKKGFSYIQQINDIITNNKKSDDFKDLIDKSHKGCYPLNDNEEYFTSDELNEDYFTASELNESEWNFHKDKHDLGLQGVGSFYNEPYKSDKRNSMTDSRDSGYFGSGTYFSTYRDLGYDSGEDYQKKYDYDYNQNPNLIQINNRLFRVDFDIYKNLYRVESEIQGNMLMTLLRDINLMFNKIGQPFSYDKESSNFNNSVLYQRIKMNCETLGLKCPTYYQLSSMMKKFAENALTEKGSKLQGGVKSFPTEFMEWQGFNGVNVSGVPYFDRYLFGSVIYDLNKVSSEDIQPVRKINFFQHDGGVRNTVGGEEYLDMKTLQRNVMRDSVIGKNVYYSDLKNMPSSQKFRVLRNMLANGNALDEKILDRVLTDEEQKRYINLVASTDYKLLSKFNDTIIEKGYYGALSRLNQYMVEPYLKTLFESFDRFENFNDTIEIRLEGRKKFLTEISKYVQVPQEMADDFLSFD